MKIKLSKMSNDYCIIKLSTVQTIQQCLTGWVKAALNIFSPLGGGKERSSLLFDDTLRTLMAMTR